MRYFATRHGQVNNQDSEYLDRPLYTPRDFPLTEIGRRQALLLGNRLLQEHFSGIILSSPFHRTLETSQIIAELVDTVIYPFPPMQEYVPDPELVRNFTGLDFVKARQKYSRIAPDGYFEYPWRIQTLETGDDVLARLAAGIEALPESFKQQELLFVGHGASVGAWLRYFHLDSIAAPCYNCTLSMLDTEDSSVCPYGCDASHLPMALRTSNLRPAAEND